MQVRNWSNLTISIIRYIQLSVSTLVTLKKKKKKGKHILTKVHDTDLVSRVGIDKMRVPRAIYFPHSSPASRSRKTIFTPARRRHSGACNDSN